jgi:hypothetical protein
MDFHVVLVIPTWRTADDRLIPLFLMSNKHLDNAIEFVERHWSTFKGQKRLWAVDYDNLVQERENRRGRDLKVLAYPVSANEHRKSTNGAW